MPEVAPMARPKLYAQHFVACRRVEWIGTPGPNTARVLDGVSYTYTVPPGTEFPFEDDEFWLFARLVHHYQQPTAREFRVTLTWDDAPGGRRVVWSRLYTTVTFRPAWPVVDLAVAFRPMVFVGRGRYEFRLWRWRAKQFSGRVRQTLACEYIHVEG